MRSLILILLCSISSWGATTGLDGQWTGELTLRVGKKATAATPQKAPLVLNVKSNGNQLTGTVSVTRGKKSRPVEIQDGKIDGNRFSFTTIRHSKKKGDSRQEWQGTVEGDVLHGTTGGKRPRQFTAKRGDS